MKKVVSLLLVVLMCFLTIACGTESIPTKRSESGKTEKVTEEDKFVNLKNKIIEVGEFDEEEQLTTSVLDDLGDDVFVLAKYYHDEDSVMLHCDAELVDSYLKIYPEKNPEVYFGMKFGESMLEAEGYYDEDKKLNITRDTLSVGESVSAEEIINGPLTKIDEALEKNNFNVCVSDLGISYTKTNVDDKNQSSTVTEEESGYEKLKKYILENGANYQGVYKIFGQRDEHSGIISCTEQGKITFSYRHEGKKNTSYVVMEFYNGSVTQSVEYLFEQEGYVSDSTGTIYTALVGKNDCEVFNIKYTEDFPSSVDDSIIEEIAVDRFPTITEAMLLTMDYILIENVGMRLNDLGFVSWSI